MALFVLVAHPAPQRLRTHFRTAVSSGPV
jgi:hypothetical protein